LLAALVKYVNAIATITQFAQLDLNRQYTYADYLTWQFADRVELIREWIKKMSPVPPSVHQRVAYNLSLSIGEHLRGQPCKLFFAPFDVRLRRPNQSGADADIATVVQPDLSVICDFTKIDRRGCLGAPDWIIEILSEGNARTDTDDKFRLYEECGVREYWIVQPSDSTIVAFDLIGGRYQFRKIYAAG
jgi:Uma2 family endonuclease